MNYVILCRYPLWCSFKTITSQPWFHNGFAMHRSCQCLYSTSTAATATNSAGKAMRLTEPEPWSTRCTWSRLTGDTTGRKTQQKWGKPWENPAEMGKTMGKPAEMRKTMGKASRKWGISCWNGDKIGEYGSISVKISFSVRLKTDYTPQWWNTYDYCNQHCCCSFSDKPIVTTEHVWFSRQTWWISKDLNSKTVILNNNSWISHGIA